MLVGEPGWRQRTSGSLQWMDRWMDTWIVHLRKGFVVVLPLLGAQYSLPCPMSCMRCVVILLLAALLNSTEFCFRYFATDPEIQCFV